MRYILAVLLGYLIGVLSVDPVPLEKVDVTPTVETEEYGDTYLVGVPTCIRPGLPAEVYVDLVERKGPATVVVELFNKTSGEIYSTAEDEIHPGSPRAISLQVPSDIPVPRTYWYNHRYHIRVNGTGQNVRFTDETTVTVVQQNVTVFVQTDKAVYKPFQMVNYRIFSIFPGLQINTAMYNVQIRDGDKNLIREDKDVSDPTGLVQGSLLLSDEPVFGQWSIIVSTEGASFTKYFDVKEYVLPRIEVTVTPPPFIVENQTMVEFDITAKYTFGEDVHGSLLVTAMIEPWYPRKKGDVQPVLSQNIPRFVGQAKVSFVTKDILSLHPYPRYYAVRLEANVTETITGSVTSGVGETRIYEVAEKLERLPSTPGVFKPNLTYTAFVKLSQQDGSPVVGTPENVSVMVQYHYVIMRYVTPPTEPPIKPEELGNLTEARPLRRGWHYDYITKTLTSKLEFKARQDGVVEINIPSVPEKAESITLTCTYKGRPYSLSATRAFSPSNTFIQLDVVKELRQPGQLQKLKLKSNVPIKTFSLLITARGRVVLTREETREAYSKLLGISFIITRAMAPRARVVVYVVTDDNEIVADVVSFNVLDPFENKVSVGFSAEEVQPGDDVTMTVQTAPNSLVATLVVDKKVLLLKSGNDITEEQVINSLQTFESCQYYGWYRWGGGVGILERRKRSFLPWRYPYFGSAIDAASVFREAGLTILTDSHVYEHYYNNFKNQRPESPDLGVDTGFPTADGEQLQEVDRLRTEFPETWLFLVEVADSNGEVRIPTIAPDSITSWEATAFAFNDQVGFGITTEPAKLTVVKPFFANLYMPYSVIRGEELFLQVNVFNYLTENQNVTVELRGSDGHKSLDISDAGEVIEVPGTRTQTLTVPSGIPKSVVFPIRTVEVGDIPITVTARSVAASDGLRKTLRSVPEGVPSEYNFVELMNLTASSPYQVTRDIEYPPGVVTDSQKLRVNLVGDLLGSTVANLANLVRMSFGCGEQNMVNFAPTVFVSRYLEEVGQLTGEKRKEAVNFISQGYQRQMNYKRRDGSYSAFGNRDKQGSQWLTAFVVKSFASASQQGFLELDEEAMRQSYTYIIRHQREDGSFYNTAKLHNRRLQGQSGKGNALTAYILSALLEGGLTDEDVINVNQTTGENNPNETPIQSDSTDKPEEKTIDLSDSIAQAQRYVENYVESSTDLYELAIGAYALTLAGSSQVDSVLSKLESRATTKGGNTYWEVEAEPLYKWSPPRRQSQAASIETTSYVCLVYALRQDIPKMAQCLTYLVGEQNDQGGYVSTQDTVVAVQALSAIAPTFYSESQSGSITVEAAGSTASFTVNDDNRLELQQAKLPVNADSVTVRGNGTGVFLISISVVYNIEEEVVQPAFSVTANLTRDTPTAVDVLVCATYLLEEASNMANIEVRLPSDFTLTAESREEMLKLAKRVEVLGNNVLLYLNEITNTEICLTVMATGTGSVNKPKPSPVRVFDYYNPDNSAFTFYSQRSLDGDFCETPVCSNDPDVCSANCEKRKRR